MGSTLKIGFLGAGKMASALAKGFVVSKIVSANELIASDVYEGARASFAKGLGASANASNLDVLRFANVLVLALKPDQVAGLLAEIKPTFTREYLLISIAAGFTLKKLECTLSENARV